jgi:hypothetical protein
MGTSVGTRVAIAAAVPLVALLGAAPGRAEPNVYYRVGNWHAFTDKDAQGAAVCGIATQSIADRRTFSLTFTVGGTDLVLQATRPGWAIPDNTPVGATVQIGLNLPWNAQATGGGSAVGWTIPAASIRTFDAQFRAGSTMIVSFPSGNEAPWVLPLNGSNAAAATLWRCVQDLGAGTQAAQPAPAAPATQPFGQMPTQPFMPPQAQPVPSQPAPPAAGP